MLTIEERKNDKTIIVMNRLLKRITAIMLTMAVVCMVGCKKADEPNNGGNNENNGGNGGETPEAPAIVSTSEVQYDGKVFVEAVFEDETKMYFEILSLNEVALVNGEFYYQDNPSLAYKYRGEIVVPETITHLGKTYSIIAIAKKAFYNNELVTSVFIPNSVTSIESVSCYNPYNSTWLYYGAFQNCSNLNNVWMSENVRNIGCYAFFGCPCYAETVIIPNYVKSIGMNAYSSENVIFNADSCIVAGGLFYPDNPAGEPTSTSSFPNMTSISFGSNVKVLPGYLFSSLNPTIVDIPASVTVLSKGAFSGCTNLEKVNNIENVLDIGEQAFYKCWSLKDITLNTTITNIKNETFMSCGLEFIEIPNSVITIGRGAFCGSRLHSIAWSNSLDTIGESAFMSCQYLTEVDIPNSVSTIGNGAFERCYALTSVSIGEAVTSTGHKTFYGCQELSSVSFGNSVKTIGVETFRNCGSLTEIVLPSSISLIYDNAFQSCIEPTSITCLATNPPILRENVFKERWIRSIYVPMLSVEAYKTADGWSEYADVIVGI